MLVLFGNGAPRTLARYLIDRPTVTKARARGWEELENGELLNLSYQQNLAWRKIAIVVLGQGRWTLIKPYVAQVVTAPAFLLLCRSSGRLLERETDDLP